ncbi:MAG: DUF4190 domain-containing protein [Treponema sp.]|jgi:hypothetical protein|nr:DUF4190 domain-containing protein [Treponema sp.]
MAIAALVCGIISVLCAFLGYGAIIGIVLGIIAIIFGVKARKDPSQAAGSATAGLVLGIIGTVLSGILFIACVACTAALGAAITNPELQDAANELQDIIDSL